jgi:hypothetical protein
MPLTFEIIFNATLFQSLISLPTSLPLKIIFKYLEYLEDNLKNKNHFFETTLVNILKIH